MVTVLEYVAKFIELAHFSDDYVAIDMAKVRKFEDGLKLSIRGKIVGLLLQDMKRWSGLLWPLRRRWMMHEISSRRLLLKIRGGRVNLLLVAREISKGLLFREGFKDRVVAIKAKAKSGL